MKKDYANKYPDSKKEKDILKIASLQIPGSQTKPNGHDPEYSEEGVIKYIKSLEKKN